MTKCGERRVIAGEQIPCLHPGEVAIAQVDPRRGQGGGRCRVRAGRDAFHNPDHGLAD